MNTTTSTAGASRRPPRKWWQWVLMYPTLLVALLGSVPTALELVRAARLGVPFGDSAAAAAQHALWERNLECTRQGFTLVVNPHQVEVGALVCPSGDVLLRVRPPGGDPHYRWVSAEGLAASLARSGRGWLPVARADEAAAPAPPPAPVCQRWLDGRRLLRRIRTADGCIDEVIDSYTGQVLERRRVDCAAPCG